MTDLRADAARNRARVLDVARRRVDDGDLALPMNALAAEAGVGVGTAYRHFRDRTGLLAALARPRVDVLLDDARAAAATDDAVAGLGALLHAVLRAQRDDPAVAELLRTGAGDDGHVADVLRALTDVAEHVLDRAKAQGVRADLHADDLRRLLCGVDHAARLGPDPAADAARYVDMLLPGLRGA